jgi:hypothetical protein
LWVWIIYVPWYRKFFIVGQKWPKDIAGFRHEGSMDIFEPLNIN